MSESIGNAFRLGKREMLLRWSNVGKHWKCISVGKREKLLRWPNAGKHWKCITFGEEGKSFFGGRMPESIGNAFRLSKRKAFRAYQCGKAIGNAFEMKSEKHFADFCGEKQKSGKKGNAY